MSDSPIARTLVTNVATGSVDGSTLIWDGGTPQWQESLDLMVVGGDVGIGIAVPIGKLHVKRTGANIVETIESDQTTAFTSWRNSVLQANHVRVGADADALVMSTDQLERMRIDSAGNVGIGAISASNLLNVEGGDLRLKGANAADAKLSIVGGANGDDCKVQFKPRSTNGAQPLATIYGLGSSGNNSLMSFEVTLGGVSSEALRIDSDGNVGINTTNPSGRQLYLVGASADYAQRIQKASLGNDTVHDCLELMTDNATGASSINFLRGSSSTSGGLTFDIATAGVRSEAMRIDSAGHVRVGTSTGFSPSTRLVVHQPTINGRALEVYRATVTTSVIAGFFSDNGGAGTEVAQITGSGTYVGPISDVSMKENIVDSSLGLTEVLALRVAAFDWKGNQEHCSAGFIAQEVQAVLPEAVAANDEGLLGRSDSNLVPVLVKAIQELTARLEVLENG